jgi:hypothetical protein
MVIKKGVATQTPTIKKLSTPQPCTQGPAQISPACKTGWSLWSTDLATPVRLYSASLVIVPVRSLHLVTLSQCMPCVSLKAIHEVAISISSSLLHPCHVWCCGKNCYQALYLLLGIHGSQWSRWSSERPLATHLIAHLLLLCFYYNVMFISVFTCSMIIITSAHSLLFSSKLEPCVLGYFFYFDILSTVLYTYFYHCPTCIPYPN